MASEGKQNVKKKGYYVSSRYKQAAEKKSIQASSREKSTFFKASGSSQGRVTESSSDSANCSKNSVSQEDCGMTSTPSSKGDIPFPSLDASVVTDRKGCLAIPRFKEGIGPIPSTCMKRSALKRGKFHNATMISCGPVAASICDKGVNEHYNKKMTEAQMNIICAEYLQAAFLDFETKKALEMRSSCALGKIHKLFSLVMIHMNKLQAEQRIIETISNFLKALEHGQKQVQMFKPLSEIIPSLEKQYRSLAEAVNATKHKLHTKGVLIPEPSSEGELIELLDETNITITEFFQAFTNAKEICTSAENLQNYIDVGEKIADSIKRGSDLLSEAQDLVLSEASLELSRVSL